MNSIVLFGSGVTMHFALESWKHLKRGAFNFWIAATIALGLGFLGGQAHEYLTAPMTWQGSTFGASFFTLTGLHGFHVFAGVCFLSILWFNPTAASTRGRSTSASSRARCIGISSTSSGSLLFFLFYLW